MKKFVKFIIIGILSLNCLLWSLSFWYNIELPDAKNSDIKQESTIIEAEGKKESFKEYIKITNKYVWVIGWAICMWIVIYAGIMLITSQWDEQDMKKANKTLAYWVVWIIASLWAYVLINVIINLF